MKVWEKLINSLTQDKSLVRHKYTKEMAPTRTINS
uniref:Uncharacterized protein n=1 Tax=Anguilla anguilla TaxID=7936 RepID=A0A0E9XUC4_ANGAN